MSSENTPERSSYGQKSAFVRANLLVILQMVKDGLTLKKMAEIIRDQAGENVSRHVISRNLSLLDLTTMRLNVRNPGRPSLFLCNVGFGDGQPLHRTITPSQKSVTGPQRKYRFIDLNQALAAINPEDLTANIARDQSDPLNRSQNHENVIKSSLETNPRIASSPGHQSQDLASQDSTGKPAPIPDIMAMFETGASPAGALDRSIKKNKGQQ